jgi:hypothetical protein
LVKAFCSWAWSLRSETLDFFWKTVLKWGKCLLHDKLVHILGFSCVVVTFTFDDLLFDLAEPGSVRYVSCQSFSQSFDAVLMLLPAVELFSCCYRLNYVSVCKPKNSFLFVCFSKYVLC